MPSALPGPTPPPTAACALLDMSPTPRSRAVPVCLDTPAHRGFRRSSAARGPSPQHMLRPASSVLLTPTPRPTDPRRAQIVPCTPRPRLRAPPLSSSAIATTVTTATTSTHVCSVLRGIGALEMFARHAPRAATRQASRLRALCVTPAASRPPRAVRSALPVLPAPQSFIRWSTQT